MKRFALLGLALVVAGAVIYGYVRLSGPEQARAARSLDSSAPVTIAVAQSADVPIMRRAIGFAEPVATVGVKARMDGVIATQKVQEGQEVKEGDLLFTLDDRELKAQIARDEAAVQRDQAALAQKRADLARQQSLVQKGAGTQQALDLAVADEATAAATVQSDQATLSLDRVRLSYAVISAPIAGRLGAITATPGNAVRANDATASLVTITQLSPIRVSFTMPERELGLLRDATKDGAKPEVRVFSAATKEKVGTGALDFIDSSVNKASGTVDAKALFPNDDRKLWPGEYVDVQIVLGDVKNAVTTPAVAVQEGQNGQFVYVLKSDNTVEARPVTVVSNENGVAAMSKGLAAGEKIVTEGQSRLSPGARARPTQAGAPAGANKAQG
ncbi:efflux RND transporter periplasmic adaptor subunit [Terrarubrum flagellatum]|uniref:efflux RND transporter periplasmic adaptor subunit n=1 Tax=Terrirubrum flagellatum TaxID=2895980 RepID=UPI0031450566